MAITLIRRTWLIFSLSSVFSTKDILESGDGIRPLASPILLTAYQMSVCSIASRLLPMSGLITVTPHQGHRYRRDPASLLISGAIICFNYAYVDLTNSFIQVARVAVFPLLSLFWHIGGTKKLGAIDTVKSGAIFVGLAIFYVADPVYLRGVLFLIAAITLEAASVAMSQKDDQGYSPSTLLFESAPVCAAICWTWVACFEGPFVPWESLGESSLLENGVTTMATHVAALYVHENAASLPMLLITLIRDVFIIVLSSFFWQLEYLQWGGYCTALAGLYLFNKGKSVGVRTFCIYLLIAAILFTATLPQTPGLPNVLGTTRFTTTQLENLRDVSSSHVDSARRPQSERSPLSGFLHSRGIGNDKTLFVTIASDKYVQPMINFKLGLDRWGLGEQFLVLCLDHECVKAAEANNIHAYGRYITTAKEEDDDWHTPVARIKFAANIDLIDGGYNFVLLDGDVYLTGARHPLSGMRQLNDASWQIQFQTDKEYAQWSKVNIGWYWARPTPAIREFFVRSQRWWNINKHEWDQSIMNDVRHNMVYSNILEYPKTIMLDPIDYKSTMLFNWPDIYMSESKIDAMNAEGVTVHYTMVYNDTKTLLAKQFGQWFDGSHYTSNPWILEPINIGGTKREILDQIAFAVHVAKITNRSFMWPNSVRLQCERNHGAANYTPPILIAEFQSVADAVPWVEGMYFRNRRRFTETELRSTYGPINEALDGSDQSLRSFFDTCRSVDTEVLTIDFDGLELWKLAERSAQDVIQQMGIVECIMCAHMERFSNFESPVC